MNYRHFEVFEDELGVLFGFEATDLGLEVLLVGGKVLFVFVGDEAGEEGYEGEERGD